MISFFYSRGGAGEIRGRQIGSYLKAKLNPESGFEDDICIYVKSAPSVNHPKKSYIDIIEYSRGYKYALKHDIGIIASSKSIFNLFKLKNAVLIPQHHCNFERIRRDKCEVKVAGIIGNKASFQYDLDDLRVRLEKIGIELKTFIKWQFKDRQEVVDAFKQIDVQLVWRPNSDGVLRNPLKLTNACSFGIPTVAYPEENFIQEFKGNFIPAGSISDLVNSVYKLKSSDKFYEEYAEAGIEKAEEYHIDNISKLYLKLC
jgi:hypothetical protein